MDTDTDNQRVMPSTKMCISDLTHHDLIHVGQGYILSSFGRLSENWFDGATRKQRTRERAISSHMRHMIGGLVYTQDRIGHTCNDIYMFHVVASRDEALNFIK